MRVILSAKNVTKRFGELIALNQVDLDIAEGSIHALIGPNGAGKTAFFNCLTGFYAPESGLIVFRGKPLTNISPDQITRWGIARTYQNIRLFANMTVLENILVGQEPHLRASWWGAILRLPGARHEEQWVQSEALYWLRFVGLKGKGDTIAKNLSYGDQRRLEMGRALASQPKLLLLDEPTAGMNPRETGELIRFIRRIRDELGTTILLIEHDMRVVMGISERVTVLDYGRKIAEGSAGEIQHHPQVIETYLGRPVKERIDSVE